MGFAGRLGIGSSRLGNILLSSIDILGDGTFDYQVHQIESNKIRVVFNTQIRIPSATDPTHYSLDIVNAPGSYIIPNIINITPYDADNQSIVLNLSQNLTTGATYSIELGEIFDINGDIVSFVTKNFNANVIVPPLAKGAYQSKNGHVDILFDKNVGSTSTAATASIRNTNGGPLTLMTLVTWAGEGLPEKTLRFQLPGAMPAADSFIIQYTDVEDESYNIGSGTIPLTLALRTAGPHDFDALNQIQLIDSYITDLSNDQINTTNLRVYFNGPVNSSGSLNTANWNVRAQDIHKNKDTINIPIAPIAVSGPSLDALVSDLISKVNSHIVEPQVHFPHIPINTITPPPTTISSLIELQEVFNDHLMDSKAHHFPDLVNFYEPIEVTDIVTAMLAANQLRRVILSHISPQPIPFSSAYPIGPITERANFGNATAYNVRSEYTYFVDLHLSSKSPFARYNIEVTIDSEDGSTSTNPADETGSILSRSLDDPVSIITKCVDPDKAIEVAFDKEIYLLRSPRIEVKNEKNQLISTEQEALSLSSTLEWVYNQLIYAYSLHIGSNNGLIHKENDIINAVSLPNYVNTSAISELIDKANSFRVKLDKHVSSQIHHFNPDTDIVKAQPASDLNSLTKLLFDLRQTFLKHNSRDGVHIGVGNRIISAKFYDLIRLETDRIQNSQNHTITGMIRGYYFNNELKEPQYTNTNINEAFTGLASKPSLASIIPKSGLVNMNGEISLESDSVEFYFSKNMQEVSLDSTNIVITGGSIQQKLALWKNDMVVSVEVSKMEQINYNGQAMDLTDKSGNLIY